MSVTTEPILIKLEIKNYHLAKPHLSVTTWVVWANTQFAIVPVFCLSFFWFLNHMHSGPILKIYMPYDVFSRKDVPFRG